MSRIYKVKTPTGDRLIEANTKGQAVNWCIDADYSAEPVSASEMYTLIQAGVKVEKADAKGKSEAGETKQQPVSTTSAPSAPQPQAQPLNVAPAAGGVTIPQQPNQAVFIPPAAVTPGQFTPPANPVIAEQQRINPNAAAAAGLPPAPSVGGPVDWEARERANG